jgi:hypothetical protein
VAARVLPRGRRRRRRCGQRAAPRRHRPRPRARVCVRTARPRTRLAFCARPSAAFIPSAAPSRRLVERHAAEIDDEAGAFDADEFGSGGGAGGCEGGAPLEG